MQDDRQPRPEKVAIVDEVKHHLQSSAGTIVTEYRGLDVAAMQQLRRSLADAGGTYKIYKNSLAAFAARDAGLESLEEILTGPTAFAFADTDPAAVAKVLDGFAKDHDALVIKGGLLGESALSPEEVTALAKLPSREVLLAKLAGGFVALPTKFAGLLAALPRNFAYAMAALIEKGGTGEAPSESPAADAAPDEIQTDEQPPEENA